MKKESIKLHLQPYSILRKRQTTINHAFASAIAPNDIYNDEIVSQAITLLGQNPNEDLLCVYCNQPAETWDHVFGLVKNFQFSGYGHIVGNLLPCCKKCNSEKGNQYWEDFLKRKVNDPAVHVKIKLLKKYFKKYLPEKISYEKIKSICPEEIGQLEKIKKEIINSMKNADEIAIKVRQEINRYAEQ